MPHHAAPEVVANAIDELVSRPSFGTNVPAKHPRGESNLGAYRQDVDCRSVRRPTIILVPNMSIWLPHFAKAPGEPSGAGVNAAIAPDELQMPRASASPVVGAYVVNDETAIRSPNEPTGR